jgi:hypothetical protein
MTTQFLYVLYIFSVLNGQQVLGKFDTEQDCIDAGQAVWASRGAGGTREVTQITCKPELRPEYMPPH